MTAPTYRPRYIDKNGMDVLETPFPSMKRAWERCQQLVHMGMAEVGSIKITSSHGDTYTIAEVENILTDNDVPFDPIA